MSRCAGRDAGGSDGNDRKACIHLTHRIEWEVGADGFASVSLITPGGDPGGTDFPEQDD